MAGPERGNLVLQAETASKEFWKDPDRVAIRYKQDPKNPQFRLNLSEFTQQIVEPAKITGMLGTLFERKLSSR